MKQKTIIIGIDGATFDVVGELLGDGRLPNIKRVVDAGVHGDLRSTVPPSTVPAWPSFYTGKSPSKMGIQGFATVQPDSYSPEIVGPEQPTSAGVWEYLDDDGYQSIVFNIPTTYPPDRIDGVMVSGLMTPTDASRWAHPEEIQSDLEELDYRISVDEYFDATNPRRYVEHTHDLLDRRIAGVQRVTERHDWDFLFVLLRPTDLLSHHFLGDFETGGPNEGVVPDVYEAVDDVIGTLLETHSGNVVLMSDHGFDHVEEQFQVNNLLREERYLSVRDEKLGIPVYLELLSKLRRTGTEVVSRLGLKELARSIVPQTVLDAVPHETDAESLSTGIDQGAIDWAETTAFGQAQAKVGKVFLNTVDRPEGWITPAEYDDVRTELLESLREAVSARDLDVDVYRGEEVYGESDQTPDIVLIVNQDGVDVDARLQGEILEPRDEQTTPGIHDHQGIFAAAGPAFTSKDERVSGLRIWDIVPTLLHGIGSSVPDDMDGDVRRDILSDTGDREVESRPPITATEGRSVSATEGIEERLEGLGYLS